MNRKWFLMPLLVGGLTAWSLAQAQATSDQPAGAQPQAEQPAAVQPQSQEPMGPAAGQNVGTQIEINVQESPAVREQAGQQRDLARDQDIELEQQRTGEATLRQRDDSALREWGELQPGRERELTQRPGAATQPAEMEAGQAAVRQGGPGLAQDPDIFVLERERQIQGYWGRPMARLEGEPSIYGFRDEPSRIEHRRGMAFRDVDGIYGFAEEGRTEAMMAPPTAGAVGDAVVLPTPEDASHSWRRGRNLVDDNLIQNRDEFEVDRDFYTKEWKVSQPPLVEHPRFHTIYDNELTQRYYTAWHGSPVLWSANAMTPTPMPETRNQLLSSRQKHTFFDSWDTDNISNTPSAFSTRTGPFTGTARISGGEQIYGYRGEDIGRTSFGGKLSRDGSVHMGGQAFYWDDQDLLESGATGPGYETFGYISPEAERGPAFGAIGVEDEHYLNVPRGTNLNVYGIPGAAEGEAETRVVETEVYGYVDTEETDRVEHKTKAKKDSDCDHYDQDRDWNHEGDDGNW